jgi:opacity protein-like surface antigen
MNKHILFVFLCFLLMLGIITSIPGAAMADSAPNRGVFEVDASGLWSTAPTAGFQDAFSGSFGFGMMLNQAKTLQGRIDYSPIDWEQVAVAGNLHYKRQSFIVSTRYYIPTYSQIIYFFGQVGIEISSDKKDSFTPSFSVQTTSKTNTGITPGLGIEFGLGPNLGFVISGRYHIITDKYFDLMAGLAVHF